MSIPNIEQFQQTMNEELYKNAHKEAVADCYLEKGIWRNIISYTKGEDKKKSLVDIANYCAILWTQLVED